MTEVPGRQGQVEAEADPGLERVLDVEPTALGPQGHEDLARLEAGEGIERKRATVQQRVDLRHSAEEVGPEPQLEGRDRREPQVPVLQPALHPGRARFGAAQEVDDEVGVGDYDAVKALIDRYGVHFDPRLRDEVVARYKRLDLPTYWAGINPDLTLATTKGGGAEVNTVVISYPRDFMRQRLGYSAMYDPSLLPAGVETRTRTTARRGRRR